MKPAYLANRRVKWAVALLLTGGVVAGCGTDGALIAPSTPASGPASTTTATPPKPTQAVKVQVSPGKQVEIVGGVADKVCEKLVQPFELSDNFTYLWSLSLELAKQTATNVVNNAVDSATTGKSGPKAGEQRKAFKRALPIELRRAAMHMNWLPMSLEVMYGRKQLEQASLLARTTPLGKKLYPKADAMLAEVLKGVTEPHAYTFELHISKEAGENAMALPGGFIILDQALVSDKPELRDKAYFALSHEVAHVLQRHQTRALQARVIDSLALGASLPDMIARMKQTQSDPAALVRLLVGGKLLFEKHAADQELQADACGVRELDKGLANDKRLMAVVRAFEQSLPIMEPPTSAGPKGGKPEIKESLDNLVELVKRPVDAHPSTAERVSNLTMIVGEISRRPGVAQAVLPQVKQAPKVIALPTDIKAGAGAK